ncbi:hypothetical protein [Niveibacterium sp. SC-1]|uniref:hypothetical protein n=1 Tax=Niveibacterium sp. SC-1 TaxID=3135646 RepID=UPI00311D56F3
MHTLMVLAAGLGLLLLCLLGAWWPRRQVQALARGVAILLPLWFIAAAWNMWAGVTQAGYSVAEETPMFLLVFGLPALVAILIGRLALRRPAD